MCVRVHALCRPASGLSVRSSRSARACTRVVPWRVRRERAHARTHALTHGGGGKAAARLIEAAAPLSQTRERGAAVATCRRRRSLDHSRHGALPAKKVGLTAAHDLPPRAPRESLAVATWRRQSGSVTDGTGGDVATRARLSGCTGGAPLPPPCRRHDTARRLPPATRQLYMGRRL